MAMDVVRQQNMQSSILFMQQEHANTLSGLHNEIHRLQQKCSGIVTRVVQIVFHNGWLCTVNLLQSGMSMSSGHIQVLA